MQLEHKDIKLVDICCGLNWGDEAKGKVIAQLSKTRKYDFVCRWAGGHNAGHTIYIKGLKYKTHIVPSGIFYNIPSIIGPDCVINKDEFEKEISYLFENNFPTHLIKVSPKAHVITNKHIYEDKSTYAYTQGSTSKGTAPCYRDKYARIGIQAKDVSFFKPFLWDEVLHGNILCEGAQGFWLDINNGNYPYVTSSTTLPYGACSLGFSPKYIRNIVGVTKIYDTRSGIDPNFPETLLEDYQLSTIATVGNELGTTTGRRRKVNWLNLNKLIQAINISGTNIIVMSKIDVLQRVNIFKLIYGYDKKIWSFDSIEIMQTFIEHIIRTKCKMVTNVIYSSDVETVDELNSII